MATSEPECPVQLGKYVYVNMFAKLGQGAFGVVYKGTDTKKNIDVAAKQLEIKDDKAGADAMAEIKTLQKLPKHTNLVALYDFHFFRSSFWVIMEFCNRGDVKSYFDDNKPLPQATIIDFMRQTAAAVDFMHSIPVPVIHRDLKPGNIMVKQTKSDPRPVIKVTDFGLSKVADVDLTKTFLMTTVAGTPCFMAPEQFAKQPYTASVDVFALGMVFLGMVNYEDIGDILPFTKGAMSMGMLLPPGMLMLQASKTGMSMPNLIEHKTSDDALMTQLKELVGRMIKFKANDRPKCSVVHQQLEAMFESVCGDVPSPPSSSPSGASSTKSEDGATGSSSNDSTNTSTSEESGENLGYLLLRQALQQYVEEGYEKKKKKEESDDVLQQLRRGVPLLELLLKGLGDGSDEKEGETKFRPGDKVKVTTDYENAKSLQEEYGGWNEQMRKYLGKIGKVERKIYHVVKVEFPDGQKWSYNPELLTKLTEEGEAVGSTATSPRDAKGDKSTPHDEIVRGLFKRFEVVQIPEEAEVVKLLQKGHGGWSEKMQLCLGIKGIINKVDKDGDVFVECINGDDWTFNPELLIKVDEDPNADVEAGDFVLVKDVTVSEARDLQTDHGGWATGMEKALGHTGIVKSTLTGNRVRVEVSRHVWILNKKLVKLVAKSEEMMVAILKRKFGM